MDLRTFYNQFVQALSRKGDVVSDLSTTPSKENLTKDSPRFVIGSDATSNTSLGTLESLIKAIFELGDQLNILTIQAAVEVSRAGKAGKGFALVADNIRALTIRSVEMRKSLLLFVDEIRTRDIQLVELTEEITRSLQNRSEESRGARKDVDSGPLILEYCNKLMQENRMMHDRINRAEISLKRFQAMTEEQ